MLQLELKSLAKSFDESPMVLEDINFSMFKGDFLVILGPSGCGKTTLLRIIAGLETANSGRVFIAGKDVTDIEPKHRDVAIVFQNYALYPHMSVYDNLAFALRVKKLSKDKINEKVTNTAGMLGLGNYLDRKPKQLSGGQRQRVALGRAIVRNPSLFLFDEPLSNLDAELRSQMRFELLSLHEQIGATSLYVTHDQIEAMSLADNIVILNEGRQIGPARPRELYDNPPDTFVAGFLGNPGMNLIEAVIANDSRSVIIDNEIIIPLKKELQPHTKVIFGFRPEHCQSSPDGQLPGEVIGVEDSGKEFILKLKGPGDAQLYSLSEKEFNLRDIVKLNISKFHLFDFKTHSLIK